MQSRPGRGDVGPRVPAVPQWATTMSESSALSSVTGWKPRERFAAPVVEIRDIQTSRSRLFRLRPDEPLWRDHEQDHR